MTFDANRERLARAAEANETDEALVAKAQLGAQIERLIRERDGAIEAFGKLQTAAVACRRLQREFWSKRRKPDTIDRSKAAEKELDRVLVAGDPTVTLDEGDDQRRLAFGGDR